METKLHVPLDKEWDREQKIWQVGFETVYVDESQADEGIVWFEYQTNSYMGSQWDNYSVAVHMEKRTVKGHGSRKHRDFILEYVLYWYLKAKNDEAFEDLLN